MSDVVIRGIPVKHREFGVGPIPERLHRQLRSHAHAIGHLNAEHPAGSMYLALVNGPASTGSRSRSSNSDATLVLAAGSLPQSKALICRPSRRRESAARICAIGGIASTILAPGASFTISFGGGRAGTDLQPAEVRLQAVDATEQGLPLEVPRRLQRFGNGCPWDGKKDQLAESHGLGGCAGAGIATGGGGNCPQLLLIFAEAEQDLLVLCRPDLAHAGPCFRIQ